MKKRSSSRQNPKPAAKAKRAQQSVTIGMDLGDRNSRYCLLSGQGEILREGQVATTKAEMIKTFSRLGRARIAIEVGTHSPWVTRLLQSLGHEVIVANPRQVKLITESSRKDDRLDAQTLARLARIDPQLLRPIQHRSEKAQTALMVIRVRAALLSARTSLVNAARGLAKSLGERLPKCDADQMGVPQSEALPATVQGVLEPLLKEVESLTEKIKDSSENRADRPGRLSRDRTPATSQWSWTSDRSHVRTHCGEQRQIPEESRYRLLSWAAAQTQRFGAASTAITNHQGRRPLSEDDAGARSTLHHQPSRT